eukprot:3048449-Pyramimonas_sp.AAC.1
MFDLVPINLHIGVSPTYAGPADGTSLEDYSCIHRCSPPQITSAGPLRCLDRKLQLIRHRDHRDHLPLCARFEYTIQATTGGEALGLQLNLRPRYARWSKEALMDSLRSGVGRA